MYKPYTPTASAPNGDHNTNFERLEDQMYATFHVACSDISSVLSDVAGVSSEFHIICTGLNCKLQ